jgi:hypothetical protein
MPVTVLADGIVLNDGNERVDLLHPVMRARVAGLCSDPRMRGTLRVESAVRTYEEQEYLYVNQHRPGFNLAADPDQWLTPAYGLPSARGSWHMVQPDGHGYAVDFLTSVLPGDVYRLLPSVAAEYRLVQTVLHGGLRAHDSPQPPNPATPTDPRLVKEWWHFQPPYNEGRLTWTPPAKDEDMTPEQEKKLDTLLIRTDLILDHIEGRKPSAEGAGPRSMEPLRSILDSIAAKVGVKR